MRSTLLMLLVFLLGCASSDQDRSSSTETAPVRGGTLRLSITSDPGTFNPVRMTTSSAVQVFAILQPSLVRLDPTTGGWLPGLASSWSTSADSLVFTFRLDRRYHWSDGESFGPEDVTLSFDIYSDDRVAYPWRSRLSPIDSLQRIGDDSLNFYFSQRVPDPLSLVTFDILPSHVMKDLPRDEVESWPIGQHPVTLGPYRLAEWQHNGRLLLERNPHFEGDGGYADAIEVSILPDVGLRWMRLSTGELDMAPSITVDQASAAKDHPDIEVHSIDGRSIAFLQFNLQNRFLKDTRVRRALSLAVDRTAITEGILAGYATPGASLLPPVSWAFDESLVPDRQDLERVHELLGEAGYELEAGEYRIEGAPLSLEMLYVTGDPMREAVASFLVQQWADAGIRVRPRPMELASLVRIAQSDGFEMMLAQFGGVIDADLRPVLRTGGGYNFGHVSVASIDEALDEATSALNRADAIAAAKRMQRSVAELQPVCVLYYPKTLIATSSRVQGATPTWLSPFTGVEHWWLAQAE